MQLHKDISQWQGRFDKCPKTGAATKECGCPGAAVQDSHSVTFGGEVSEEQAFVKVRDWIWEQHGIHR